MNSLLLWMEQEKIALSEEQKERIAAFEQELQQAKALAEELQKDVEQRQMAQLVEEALRQAGGRNIPVLWALLDKERLSLVDGEIQGLAEQLKELKESEDTAFLFAGRHAQPQFVTVGKQPASVRMAQELLWVSDKKERRIYLWLIQSTNSRNTSICWTRFIRRLL